MTPEKIIMLFSFGAFVLSVFNVVWLKLGEWSKWERCGRLILPKSMVGGR